MFVEKTWAPAQNPNWAGYSLDLMFREEAKSCIDCGGSLPGTRPLHLKTNFYFANLGIPQASSSSSPAYALAFSYLVRNRQCKLSKVLTKKQDPGTRDKTGEEILLECVETPSKRDGWPTLTLPTCKDLAPHESELLSKNRPDGAK